jgi:predicted DNA-binding transcriptional regulator AlpA
MVKRGRPRARVAGEEVVFLRDQGLSWRQIARKLGIGRTTAYDLLKQAQNTPKTPSEKCQERSLGWAKGIV